MEATISLQCPSFLPPTSFALPVLLVGRGSGRDSSGSAPTGNWGILPFSQIRSRPLVAEDSIDLQFELSAP